MIEKSAVHKALAEVASTKAGQDFLRWLMDYCGYKYSSLTMTAEGVILTDAIVHNEAKRAVWLDIRKAIPAKLLNNIEKEAEIKPNEKKEK